LRSGASREQIRAVVDKVNEVGYRAHLSAGQERTIIGVIGDERPLNETVFRAMDGVEKVVRILRPFKLASRDFHPDDTIVSINGVEVGGPQVAMMAGRAR
jgi:3-deoxy-7-phosphoheptulonate synthase